MVTLIGVAHAQNLDQGKPGAKLFADSCSACHHRAGGLAKGRFNLALFWFLQQHYTTSSSSAWTLTSYLESVDGPKRNQAGAAAAKSARRSSPAAMRPAAPIAGR
jgi:mono/diheme cytochrome c family protein